MPAHVHILIKRTAEEFAGAVYDECCTKYNWFYKKNPNRGKYIAKTWPLLLQDARAQLAACLGTIKDPALQNEVYDALIKDNTLQRGRNKLMVI